MTTAPPGRHLTGAAYPTETPMASRPKPITDAVKYVGSGISALLGVVQTLVVLNVLSAEQAEQIAQLGGAVNAATPVLADATTLIVGTIAGLITAGTGVFTSLAVAKTAEARVTPLESPHDADGHRLEPVGPVAR